MSSSQRPLAALAVLLSGLVLAPCVTSPARAELGATGTRLQIPGGPVRAYMTYGHIEDQELYAPLAPELTRLGIAVRLEGKHYSLYKHGQKIAEWPFVTSKEEVPETAEEPVVLAMGGQIFLPVRALGELLSLDPQWLRKENVVALVPNGKRPPVAVNPVAPATRLVNLSGVELIEGPKGLEVRVKADGPVYPTWVQVKQAPIRLALDFPGARWTANPTLPAPMGMARAIRTGHVTETTARLVLEVPSTLVKFTAMRREKDDLIASVGEGVGVASMPLGRAPLPVIASVPRTDEEPIRINKPVAPRVGKSKVRRLTAMALGGRGQVVSSRLFGRALSGKTICIDPGHGGHSSGAKGLFSLEKDHCLAMSLRVKDTLESLGAKVVMTRSSDVYVSLEDRCAFAIANKADLFISIHCNSTPERNSGNGTQTYFTTPQSVLLAQALHDRLVAGTERRDGGIRPCRFYVCRNVPMPSVLLEVAFINNTQEEKVLADKETHDKVAGQLAVGVLEYFNTVKGVNLPETPVEGDGN